MLINKIRTRVIEAVYAELDFENKNDNLNEIFSAIDYNYNISMTYLYLHTSNTPDKYQYSALD